MAGLNKVMLIGNLGKDPEMRYGANGDAITSFSLAVNDYKDRVEWFNIVAFGKAGETMAQYLTKGQQAYIEGRLQTRNYEAKDGTKKYMTEVVVNNFTFLGAKGERVAHDADVSEIDPEDVPFEL